MFVVFIAYLFLFARINADQAPARTCKACDQDKSFESDDCKKKIDDCANGIVNGTVTDADNVTSIIPSYLSPEKYRYFSDLIDLVISKGIKHFSSLVDLRAQNSLQEYDYNRAQKDCIDLKDDFFLEEARVEDLLNCAVILLQAGNFGEANQLITLSENKNQTNPDVQSMRLFANLYPYLDEKSEDMPALQNNCDPNSQVESVLFYCACGLYENLSPRTSSGLTLPSKYATKALLLAQGESFPSFAAEACGHLLVKVGMWYEAVEKDFNIGNQTAAAQVHQPKFASVGVANKLAKIAYSRDRTWEQAQEMTRYGFKITHFRRKQSQETAGIVIHKENQVWIVYHGSESCEDWCADLKFWTVPGDDYGLQEGRVHAGFSGYVQESWSSLHEILKHEVHVNAKVLVIGHSLGGAQAILGALLVRKHFLGLSVIYVGTFGSPRVMTLEAAEAFDKKDINILVIRGRNVIDPVPRAPPYIPWFWTYTHVGQEHLIDRFTLNPHGLIQWEKAFDLSSTFPKGRLLLLVLWHIIPAIRDVVLLSYVNTRKNAQVAIQNMALFELILFLLVTWSGNWMTWILRVIICIIIFSAKFKLAEEIFDARPQDGITLHNAQDYAFSRILIPIAVGLAMLIDWVCPWFQIDNDHADFLFAILVEVLLSFVMILVLLPFKAGENLYAPPAAAALPPAGIPGFVKKRITELVLSLGTRVRNLFYDPPPAPAPQEPPPDPVHANPYIIGLLLFLLTYVHPIISAAVAFISFYKMIETNEREVLLSLVIVILAVAIFIYPVEWVICWGGRWFGALFTLDIVKMLYQRR